MFSGPDAPYLLYEEDLYFRDDGNPAAGMNSWRIWDRKFSVTRAIYRPAR